MPIQNKKIIDFHSLSQIQRIKDNIKIKIMQRKYWLENNPTIKNILSRIS